MVDTALFLQQDHPIGNASVGWHENQKYANRVWRGEVITQKSSRASPPPSPPPDSAPPQSEDDIVSNVMVAQFMTAAMRWKADTEGSSSIHVKTRHVDYQVIIAMGEKVLPLILKELEREMGHWFPALKRISGCDPVPNEYRGRIEDMRRCWLEWGRAEGLID